MARRRRAADRRCEGWYAEQKKELAALEAEFRVLIDQDLAAVSAIAAKLGIGYVVVPVAKSRE